MRTRKRLREANARSQLGSRYFGFHPILEAVAQFLEFKDCASVASLSIGFQRETWVYILRSPTRDSDLNAPIILTPKSFAWLSKFANELRHQKLILSNNYTSLQSLKVPRLYWLMISDYYQHSLTLPRLDHLHIDLPYKYYYSLDLNGLQTLDCSVLSFESVSEVVAKFPASLTTLWFDCHGLDVKSLPTLPQLTKLYLYSCKCIHGIEELPVKCPSLDVLHIDFEIAYMLHSKHLQQLAGLRVHTLELVSAKIWDLGPLRHVHVQVLDLQGCPAVHDYKPVQHIPLVLTS